MKAIVFAGFSGSGKTTLVEQLIPLLKQQGQRVSVVKHAHHRFDIDQPGKDSWRHRQAGAFEVVIASDMRLALVREFEQPEQVSVHALIAELSPGVDWVLVEGFKSSNLPKMEVWRAVTQHPLQFPTDPLVCAVATDAPLPVAPHCPTLDLNDPAGVADWLLQHADQFAYQAPPCT
jgi:molybdopterin-guanine dinucleotide biosynthesis protein B